MAVFDPTEQRMCVRVVYDGVAAAGKTTNLRQLQMLFAGQRATEVVSPADIRGRTLYFDWMLIAAGVVCGYPLLCQVVSVPGQLALDARRRHLLSTADVIVYVCDSSEAALAEARDGLSVLGNVEAPVIVQANKQDRVDALDGAALVRALGVPEHHVVEAIATEGIGVVDTFVSAVRVVARALQAKSEGEGLMLRVRPADGMEQTLDDLDRAPIDPEGAAELLLEEASAAFLLDGINDDVEHDEHEKPTTPTRRIDVPLPSADVPTGFIWPAHTGRTTLRTLASALGGSAPIGPDGIELTVGDHVLSTSYEACFVESEAAQQALVKAARERTQLEGLLVRDSVLVLQPAADGSSWLWTVRPRTEPLGPWLAEDPTRADLVAAALAEAVELTLRRGRAFEPRLDAFTVQNDTIRYVGKLAPTTTPRDSALALIRGVGEPFADAMLREIHRRLGAEEIALLSA